MKSTITFLAIFFCSMLYAQEPVQIILPFCPAECMKIDVTAEPNDCVKWMSNDPIEDSSNSIIEVCPTPNSFYTGVVSGDDGNVRQILEYTFTQRDFCLESVTFHKPSSSNSHWIELAADPTPNSDLSTIYNDGELISGANMTTAFENNEGAPRRKPVAYVGGKKARISAEIKGNGNEDFFLKAVAINLEEGDQFELPWKKVSYNSNSGLFSCPTTAITQNLTENKILHYPEFKLEWFMSVDNTDPSNDFSIGITQNPLYVLYDVPVEIEEPYPISLVDIACEGKYDPNTTVESIDENIYKTFLDQKVTKFRSSNAMRYWGGGARARQTDLDVLGRCFTYQALIAYEDATCGAWGDLLISCFNLHGLAGAKPAPLTVANMTDIKMLYLEGFITNSIVYESNRPDVPEEETLFDVTFENEKSQVFSGLTIDGNLNPIITNLAANNPSEILRVTKVYFLVKNWDVENIPNSPNEQEHRFMVSERGTPNIIDNPFEYTRPPNINLTNSASISYLGSEGIPSQGVPNPLSEFENHFLISYDGKLFDPSYGVPTLSQSSSSEWEEKSVEGYGILVNGFFPSSINSSGMPRSERLFWVLEKEEAGTNQIRFPD